MLTKEVLSFVYVFILKLWFSVLLFELWFSAFKVLDLQDLNPMKVEESQLLKNGKLMIKRDKASAGDNT